MEKKPTNFNLTRFSAGSSREILHIAFPLMLASISANFMLFCDRIILAHFSLDAMNAVAIATMMISVFQFGLIAIASIAEVFVGQYNGAGLKRKMAEPVWQMIWLSLFSALLFIPLALYSGQWIIPHDYQALGLPFYQPLTAATPLVGVSAAISAFFIGRGKTRLVMYSTIAANVLNLGLDIILIFGVPHLVPAMGTLGAAIASIFAQSIQVLILFLLFLNEKNRKKYGTDISYFNPSVMWNCIRIGAPNAIGHMVDIGAWAFLISIMARVSNLHVTVTSIGTTIYILFAFVTDGLWKSVTTLSANFFGAQNWRMVRRVTWSATRVLFILMLLLAIPLLIFPDVLIHVFVSSQGNIPNLVELKDTLRVAMVGLWVFFIADGLSWIFAGVLTAAGDTIFVMIISSTSVWIFAVLPVYIWIVHPLPHGSAKLIFFIVTIYSSVNAALFYWRYQQETWRNALIMK
ncbi:MAG: MATE family efflux transporter [Gammaproteobacteria bacterium]|nr:MATE family efflux transporter [Gammaproteobacteria bacterium]